MSTPTKPRGPQAKPTRAELTAAWNQLRAAAGQGDIQASALLIALAENKPVIAMGTQTA